MLKKRKEKTNKKKKELGITIIEEGLGECWGKVKIERMKNNNIWKII